jgi:alkylation response protein AidB-like acyl-CoA dehydrogenase
MRDGELVTGPDGAPVMREPAFRAEHVEVIDTWESTGLRATASHDFAVSDVVVPREHTMWFGEQPRVGRPLYVMPPIAMFATFIAAVSVGIARHAIDEFVTLAGGKTPVFSPNALADKAVAQDRVGRAHVGVESARCYLLDRLGALWARVEGGHVPTLDDRGELWLASTHAAHAAVAAVDALFVSAGASAVYRECALDRCLRDVRTAAQHVCTQEQNFELAGRLLLGRSVVPSPRIMDRRGPA